MAVQGAAIEETRSSDASNGRSLARHPTFHVVATISRAGSKGCTESADVTHSTRVTGTPSGCPEDSYATISRADGQKGCKESANVTHLTRVNGAFLGCPGGSYQLTLAATVRRSSVSSLLRVTTAKLPTGEFQHVQ